MAEKHIFRNFLRERKADVNNELSRARKEYEDIAKYLQALVKQVTNMWLIICVRCCKENTVSRKKRPPPLNKML